MIIDRISEEFAFIETDSGKIVKMPVELLPENAREGDVLVILADKEKTEDKRKRIKAKMDRLFKA